jgi:acyl-coenzyme A thioesterase PaaI-like protein
MSGLGTDALRAFIDEEFPQAKLFGFDLVHAGTDHVLLRFVPSTMRLRPGASVSGPILMTLVDTSVYFALLAQVGREPLAVTSDLHIRFLGKPRLSPILTRAVLLKLGKTLAVGEARITDEASGELLAFGTATYRRPSKS